MKNRNMTSNRLLFAQNKYHPIVKISDWDLVRQAEPKDNDPYDPEGRNYFLSTYNRIGTLYDKIPKSETHDMLEQIWMKPNYESIYPRKPLVNFISYDTTEAPAREINFEEANLSQYPKFYGITDYRSTMQRDYQPIDPQPLKPVTLSEQNPLMNRICLSELNDGASTRRFGRNKFLDDGLSDFYKNRDLRQWRYSSYDPIVGRYTLENC